LDPHDVLILDLTDVPSVDLSAAIALENIIRSARAHRQDIILVGLNWRVARLFSQMKIIDLVKETERVESRRVALVRARQMLDARDAGA